MTYQNHYLEFDKQSVTIKYYSENQNHQATYIGSVIMKLPDESSRDRDVITSSSPSSPKERSDELPLIINPLDGKMERYATPDQFAVTLEGHFGGSVRLKKGSIILPSYDLKLTTQYIFYRLHESDRKLQDLYLLTPIIESLRITDYDPHRFDLLYQLASRKYEGRAYLSFKKIIQILSRGNYQRLFGQY